MPPRTALPRTTFPFSFIPSSHTHHQQYRYASILGSLADNPGSYSKKIRKGRGPSSGKGKTSGRGMNGQKQHGKVPAGFNGGQTSDEKVHGIRGFDNQFSIDLTKVNLDRVQSWIDQGRLDTSRPITIKEMHKSRLTHGIKDGVKLLARNASDLRTPIHITVSRASAAAIAAVEAVGGTVQTRYYTRPSIRRILKGETHPTLSLLSQPPPSLGPSETETPLGPDSGEILEALATDTPASSGTLESTTPIADSASFSDAFAAPTSSTPPNTLLSSATPITNTHTKPTSVAHTSLISAIRAYRYRLPDPASRKDLEYYRDRAHRGYLAYQLKEGQGPSLFFRSPREAVEGDEVVAGSKRRMKSGGKGGKGENRIW